MTPGGLDEKQLRHPKEETETPEIPRPQSEEFARQVGVDPITIARSKRGDRQPTGKYITAILTNLHATDLA